LSRRELFDDTNFNLDESTEVLVIVLCLTDVLIINELMIDEFSAVELKVMLNV